MSILPIYIYLIVFYIENMLHIGISNIPGLSLFNLSIYFLLFSWAYSIVRNRTIIDPSGINIYIFLLIFFAVFSIPYQLMTNAGLTQSLKKEIIDLKVWANPFITFLCIYNVLNDESDCKKTLYGLMILLFFSALITPLTSMGLTGTQHDFYEGRASGFAEPNQYAGYLVLFIPAIISYTLFNNRLSVKIVNAVILVVVFIAFITTGSRGGLVALIASISYFFFTLYRQKAIHFSRILFIIIALMIFIPIAFILAPSQAKHGYLERLDPTNAADANLYTTGRLGHLERGLKYFTKRPIFGYGLGGYNKLALKRYGTNSATHNQYLDYLVGFGIIGLLLYLLIYYKIFRVILNHLEKITLLFDKHLFISYLAGLSGYMVAMLAVNLGSNPRYMLWAYTAVILKYLRIKASTSLDAQTQAVETGTNEYV